MRRAKFFSRTKGTDIDSFRVGDHVHVAAHPEAPRIVVDVNRESGMFAVVMAGTPDGDTEAYRPGELTTALSSYNVYINRVRRDGRLGRQQTRPATR